MRGFAPDWYIPKEKRPKSRQDEAQEEVTEEVQKEENLAAQATQPDVKEENLIQGEEAELAARQALAEEERKKKEAEIESMRSEWQPMGTTCKAWPF